MRICGSQSDAVSMQQRPLAAGEPPAAVEVPEVGERALEVPHPRAADPHVRVAPLGGVRRADVVAAEEGDLLVDHQQLAVVAAVAAQVPEAEAGVPDRVAHHLERGGEALEGGGDDHVGEAVVDAVDVDAPVGGGGQGGLELPPDLVALPDVGLEEDLLLRAVDRGQHVVVEVAPEGVRRDHPAADRHGLRLGDREGLGLLAAATVGVDERQRDGERRAGARAAPAQCVARRSACGRRSRAQSSQHGPVAAAHFFLRKIGANSTASTRGETSAPGRARPRGRASRPPAPCPRWRGATRPGSPRARPGRPSIHACSAASPRSSLSMAAAYGSDEPERGVARDVARLVGEDPEERGPQHRLPGAPERHSSSASRGAPSHSTASRTHTASAQSGERQAGEKSITSGTPAASRSTLPARSAWTTCSRPRSVSSSPTRASTTRSANPGSGRSCAAARGGSGVVRQPLGDRPLVRPRVELGWSFRDDGREAGVQEVSRRPQGREVVAGRRTGLEAGRRPAVDHQACRRGPGRAGRAGASEAPPRRGGPRACACTGASQASWAEPSTGDSTRSPARQVVPCPPASGSSTPSAANRSKTRSAGGS